MLLVGQAEGAPFVQMFNPATKTWNELAAAGPVGKEAIHPYYQAAYDPTTKTVYCLSGGPVLYALNLADKTWKVHPPAPELEGLSWHTLACDPVRRCLVVVGADKKANNLGWCRTVIYDIPSEKWSRLEVADEKVVREHRDLVAIKEAAIDLAGRIRLAWYRDPKGVGIETELKTLVEHCENLKKMPQMDQFARDTDDVSSLVKGRETLDALKAARTLVRKVEQTAEAQYPVPCAAQLAAGIR